MNVIVIKSDSFFNNKERDLNTDIYCYFSCNDDKAENLKFYPRFFGARVLTISMTLEGKLPQFFESLTGLEKLDLSGLRLTKPPSEIPKDFRAFRNSFFCLAEYCLTNSLTEVPKFISGFSKLGYLDLSNNRIESVPEFLSELVHLKTLKLSNNLLTSVPEFVGGFVSLRTLDLSKNKITNISKLPSGLKNLNIQENIVTSLPVITSLISLDISNNLVFFRGIPENICQMTNLEVLDLSRMFFPTIPEAFGNLINLKILNLSSNNQLKKIPDCVGKLISLEKLNISLMV